MGESWLDFATFLFAVFLLLLLLLLSACTRATAADIMMMHKSMALWVRKELAAKGDSRTSGGKAAAWNFGILI